MHLAHVPEHVATQEHLRATDAYKMYAGGLPIAKPIKDEILDRLALETAERRAIYNADEEPSAWRELWRSSAIKSFLVGVGLGLLVLFAMWSAPQPAGSFFEISVICCCRCSEAPVTWFSDVRSSGLP